jgi:hypothetical protein
VIIPQRFAVDNGLGCHIANDPGILVSGRRRCSVRCLRGKSSVRSSTFPAKLQSVRSGGRHNLIGSVQNSYAPSAEPSSDS